SPRALVTWSMLTRSGAMGAVTRGLVSWLVRAGAPSPRPSSGPSDDDGRGGPGDVVVRVGLLASVGAVDHGGDRRGGGADGEGQLEEGALGEGVDAVGPDLELGRAGGGDLGDGRAGHVGVGAGGGGAPLELGVDGPARPGRADEDGRHRLAAGVEPEG